MMPGRFNFGDDDDNRPRSKGGGLTAPLLLAIAAALAVLAHILNLDRLAH